MNGSRYYVVRSEGTKYGIGFGSALAIAISYTNNKSILWAIIHGILGWLYAVCDLLCIIPVVATAYSITTNRAVAGDTAPPGARG